MNMSFPKSGSLILGGLNWSLSDLNIFIAYLTEHMYYQDSR
jgi:hypothetical protein